MPRQSARQRRRRLQIVSRGNTVTVFHARREVPIPANWREMLLDLLNKMCDQPRVYLGKTGDPAFPRIPRPTVFIGKMMVPDSMVVTIERKAPADDSHHGTQQYRCLDEAVERMDVSTWPTNVRVKIMHRNGQVYISTNLRSANGHSLTPAKINWVLGINRRHVVPFTTRKGALGLKTNCDPDGSCTCRTQLPNVWQLAWEM